MTDYTYSKVAVYAELGGALRLARNSRTFVTDPVTGLPVNVTQSGFTAPYLDTDSHGIADFTATTPGPIRLTTGATFVDVYSEEMPALGLAAVTSSAASAASAAVSASLVGAPADTAVAAIVGNPASATRVSLSSTYAAQFTAVPGVTTVAQITAWLAIPYAGKKRLTGSATGLTAPLVIPSNTYLDATGASLTMSASAGCNMLNNTAVTPLRAGSGDAVVTGGSTTVTSATGAFTSADVGRVLTVAFTNESVRGANVYATILTVNSATSVVVDNACNFTQSGGVARIYARDTNIHVTGGTWNSCPGTSVQGNSLHFRRVDNLSVTNMNVYGPAGSKYQIAPGDCTEVLVENIHGVATGGGCAIVQFNGPGTNLTVRGISGSSYDDAVAFTTTDYGAYNDCHGSYQNLRISNLATFTSPDKLVGIYTSTSNYVDGHSYNGVVVDNVKDLSGTSAGICTAIAAQDTNSRIDNLTISNSTCPINLGHTQHGVVTVNNCVSTIVSTSSSGATTNATDTLAINGGTITFGYFTGCNINMFTFKSAKVIQPDIDVWLLSGSTINSLNFSDCVIAGIGGSKALVAIETGNTVNTIRIARSTVSKVGDVLYSRNATLTTLYLTDTIVDSTCGRLAECSSTGGFICKYANVTFAGNYTPFYAGTGPMTLIGSGFTNSLSIAWDRGASEVIHVNDPTLHGDIALLAKGLGDTAYNSNSAYLFVGPCITDTAKWRVLSNGINYQREGTSTLVAGTKTVADTSIGVNSVIALSYQTIGGTPGAVFISARVAGASFTITSTNAADTSVIQWDVITY